MKDDAIDLKAQFERHMNECGNIMKASGIVDGNTYFPVHDTSPPADQIITTHDSKEQLERFRAVLQGRSGHGSDRRRACSWSHPHHHGIHEACYTDATSVAFR